MFGIWKGAREKNKNLKEVQNDFSFITVIGLDVNYHMK